MNLRIVSCGAFAFGAYGLLAGCLSGGDGSLAGDNVVGSVEQALVPRGSWSEGTAAHPRPAGILLGIAEASSGTYAWYSSGWTCRSTGGPTLCSTEKYIFSAPDTLSNIVGIGVAKNTEHIYAWYLDGTVTQGTTDNFTFYSGGKLHFNTPARPNGQNGFFQMSELLEVDNSPNGEWYYYWLNTVDNLTYRTTGTSGTADSGSRAQQATVSPNHGSIVGISFNYIPRHADFLDVWNSDHTATSTTNSLVLSSD